MTAMPSGILAANCNVCDNMFTINVNSNFVGITVTQQYIPNSVYNFLVIFSFPSASFVPTFEFVIQINNVHAGSFTSADMAQRLRGSFNADSFATTPAALTAAASTSSTAGGSNLSTGLRPPPTFGINPTVRGFGTPAPAAPTAPTAPIPPNATTSTTVNQQIIKSIFG